MEALVQLTASACSSCQLRRGTARVAGQASWRARARPLLACDRHRRYHGWLVRREGSWRHHHWLPVRSAVSQQRRRWCPCCCWRGLPCFRLVCSSPRAALAWWEESSDSMLRARAARRYVTAGHSPGSESVLACRCTGSNSVAKAGRAAAFSTQQLSSLSSVLALCFGGAG